MTERERILASFSDSERDIYRSLWTDDPERYAVEYEAVQQEKRANLSQRELNHLAERKAARMLERGRERAAAFLAGLDAA